VKGAADGHRRGRAESRAYISVERAMGAVDGHRRGWGYIVEFPHPMYFYLAAFP
jgi:hypothetical protein